MNRQTKLSVSILLIITFLFSPLIPIAPVFAAEIQQNQIQNLQESLTKEQAEELAKAKKKKEELVKAIKPMENGPTFKGTMSKDQYLDYIYGGHTNAIIKIKEDGLKYNNLKEKLIKENKVSEYERVNKSFPWDSSLYEPVKTKDIVNDFQIEASAQDPRSFYNTVVGPSEMNRVKNIKYSDITNSQETISPQTGDLILQQVDAVLPGRNGLDLKLARNYSSNRALFGDYKVMGNGYANQDYSTYELDRYALGVGWSFAFPSVEVAYNEGRKELYYHTGSGGSYHVNFTTDSTDSNLENYELKDAEFKEDTTYNNGQVQSKYVFNERNLKKSYFAEDGRLLAIKNNLDNVIQFTHTEQQVGNLAPNWNFNYPEGVGIWANYGFFNYDETKGYNDTSSLKFFAQTYIDIASESKYIEIKPNQKYILSGYLYDSLGRGVLSIDAKFYDQSGQEIQSPIRINAVATKKNEWQFVETSYTAPANAVTARLRFVADGYATGSGWLDNIRFSQANPLISNITDTIGREVTFTYQESIYKNYEQNNMITMKIFDPEKTTFRKWDFYRNFWNVNYTTWYGDRNFVENKRYLSLAQAWDPVDNYELYTYNTNWNQIETKWKPSDKNLGSNAGYGSPLLISKVEYPISYANYTYERVARNFGASGLFEVNRVKSRYDQLKSDSGPKGPINNMLYTYTNDTSGWPSYSDPNQDVPSYTCSSTATTDQGRTITTSFKGLKGQKQFKTEDTNLDGEKRITESETFDTRFTQLPTRVRTDFKNSSGATRTLYEDTTYNDWGGIATETSPITSEQLTNNKQLYTRSYSYEPTFKQKTEVSYYQNSGRYLKETIEYDDKGRASLITDAKLQKSKYIYDDPTNPSRIIESRQYYTFDTSYAKTTYQYTYAYDIKPTKEIKYYTDSYDGTPIQKTSENNYEYDPLWGGIKKYTDPKGRTTTYTYDPIGRIFREIYPSYTDNSNVVHNSQMEYSYTNEVVLPNAVVSTDWNGLRVFRVTTNIKDNGVIYNEKNLYYDGSGNLLQSQAKNYLDATVTTSNHFNNYNQLDWSQDAKNNRTYYTFDSWDRLKQVKDSQTNTYNITYDEIANTVKKGFTPNGGTEQNQYLEALDQWDRVMYQETYPSAGKTIRNKYEYDLVGNLVKFTSPKYVNTTVNTQYEYDELDRPVKVVNAKGEITQYDYDRLGGLKTQTEGAPNPPVNKTRVYDERGLITEKKDEVPRSTLINYNEAGQIAETTDRKLQKTVFDYDTMGRLNKMTMGSDRYEYYYNPVGTTLIKDFNGTVNRDSLSYSYSSSGHLKSTSYGALNVSYGYDNNNNLTNIAGTQPLSTQYNYNNLNQVDIVTTAGSKQISYTYYPNGLIDTKTFPALADGTSLTVKYTYDNAMRLDTITNKKGTTVLSSFDYDYDDNDNVVAITTNGQRTDYVYDELDRLTEIHKPGQTTIVYQYDTRGNRKQVQGQEVPLTGQIDYQYDAVNRLKQVQKDGQTTTFNYDPTGIRANKVTTTGTEKYVYDQQNRIVAITDDTNNVKFQIVWGLHEPVLLKDVATGKIYYYVLNGRGDVIQLIDEQGAIVNNYNYDEWGNILNKNEGVKNILRYASEPFDDETGLYYLRARYYDPSMGRFINEDTYEGDIADPLSLNVYTYVKNNPLKFNDPSGHIGVYSDGTIYMTDGDTEIDRQLLELKIEYSTHGADKEAIAAKAEKIRKGNPNIKGETPNWHVSADKSLDYYTITDITDKLMNTMKDAESKYRNYGLEYDGMVLSIFYSLVRKGGPYDLKNQPDWQHEQFIFDDEIVNKDVPGNICYGYLGKAMGIKDTTLLAGAGFAQWRAGTSNKEWRNLRYFGDDPRDTARIYQGIIIYQNKDRSIWW